MNSFTDQDAVGTVVTQKHQAADIFRAHGIDFCCGGKKTIAEVTAEKQYSSEETQALLKRLNAPQSEASAAHDFASWPLDLLTDYIEKKHHRYVEENVGPLQGYLDKIARVHGGRRPELIQMAGLFREASGELVKHLKKEELMLFPILRKMATEPEALSPEQKERFQKVMAQLHEEHDFEGDLFRKMAALSNNYTPPENACNTYRIAYAKLADFEKDLHFHVHLENNVLFRRGNQLC